MFYVIYMHFYILYNGFKKGYLPLFVCMVLESGVGSKSIKFEAIRIDLHQRPHIC